MTKLKAQRQCSAGQPDYIDQWDRAHRRVKEAFAEWVMLFEHETGQKLELELAD